MTPLIAPTSPRPRFRQPGCSATLRPASNRTRGNQVREKGIGLTHRLYGPRNKLILFFGPHRLWREAGLYRASLHYRQIRRRNHQCCPLHALWQTPGASHRGFPCRPCFLVSILNSSSWLLLPDPNFQENWRRHYRAGTRGAATAMGLPPRLARGG